MDRLLAKNFVSEQPLDSVLYVALSGLTTQTQTLAFLKSWIQGLEN